MNNIKEYREAKGYSKTQLAILTSLSVGYISHLEKDKRKNPTLNAMTRISNALDKDIQEVFF